MYIDEQILTELIKKYGSDYDLGFQIRKLYFDEKDQMEKKTFTEHLQSCTNYHDDDEINCC